jgi:CBS-domain-containing membrane protein
MFKHPAKSAKDYQSPIESFMKDVPMSVLVEKMLTEKLRVAAIIDPNNKHPIGILTRSDIMRSISRDLQAQDIREGTAERLMNSPVTISESAILTDVIKVMTQPFLLHTLLVIDLMGKLSGVLYQEDVIRWWNDVVIGKKD